MSSSNGGSASNSGPTSTSGPTKAPGGEAQGQKEQNEQTPRGVHGSQPTRLEKKAEHIGLSESAFLAKEANDARAAISNTIAKLKGDVTGAADLRPIVGSYPWLALGAAAVAGFVGASVMVKSKHEKAIERLAALEKAMALAAGDRSTLREAAVAGAGASGRRKASHGGGGMIAKMFDELVKPAVMSAVTANFAAKKTTETAVEKQANGAGIAAPAADPGQYS